MSSPRAIRRFLVAVAQGIIELENQVKAIASGSEIVREVYPKQIAFNVIPQVDAFYRQWLHERGDEDGERGA